MGFETHHHGLALPDPVQRDKLHGIVLGGQDLAFKSFFIEADAGPADIKGMRAVIAVRKEHDAPALFRHAKAGHSNVQRLRGQPRHDGAQRQSDRAALRMQLAAKRFGKLDVETNQVSVFIRIRKRRIVLQDSHTQILSGVSFRNAVAEKGQQEQQTERHEKPAQGKALFHNRTAPIPFLPSNDGGRVEDISCVGDETAPSAKTGVTRRLYFFIHGRCRLCKHDRVFATQRSTPFPSNRPILSGG